MYDTDSSNYRKQGSPTERIRCTPKSSAYVKKRLRRDVR